MPIEPGTTLGAYEVHEFLGESAMGTVYRAYHAGLARPAAVKVLQAIAPDPDATARFRREAQSIAQMRHPNVLNVYDFGEYQGTPYMIVEYMPGGSLSDRLKAGERTDRPTTLHLLDGIAAALDYAHSLAIVHRDVKPANVLLDGAGNPVLADFGLAKLLQSASVKTVSVVTTGTPAYMSPEQVMGSSVGPPADTYALTTMAYELLAGAIPFEGEGMLELLYAHVHREPPVASTRNPELSPAVDAVLARGLAKDPDVRWETGSAMVAALRVALAADLPPPIEATMALSGPVRAVPPARIQIAAPAAAPAAPPAGFKPAVAPPTGGRRFRSGLIVGGLGGVIVITAALLLLALAARGHPSVTLSASTVDQGGAVTARFAGFKAGQSVEIFVASAEQKLTTIRADTQGQVVHTFTVPRTFPIGEHELKGCVGADCAQAPFRVTLRRGA
jgi:eukaryotic-like serine/threonine-protein kinase